MAEEKTNPADELVGVMEGRGHFYRLLARVFGREVDTEFLLALRDQKDLLSAMRDVSRTGQQALKEFFLKASDRGIEDVALDLAVEYATLFLGTGRSAGKSISPYASVHLGADKSLMQEPYRKIRELYARAGYERSAGSRELDDHVSVVLEFLSRMADATAEALSNGDMEGARKKLALQAAFLAEDVLNWVPALCRDVARYDSTGFYRGFALITAGFLKTDIGVVDEVLEELTSTAS